MSGTNVMYAAICAYANPTRCPVLTSRMLLPGEKTLPQQKPRSPHVSAHVWHVLSASAVCFCSTNFDPKLHPERFAFAVLIWTLTRIPA
eukprot:2216699-Rhodomonas_salina.1